MKAWLLIDSGPGSSSHNMALDEALLEAMPRLQSPVLRFYGWAEPAASFGYFQKYSAIEPMTALRPLVRRPTGGGLVPHEADWTYSLAFPTHHPWYAFTAKDSYRRAHEWIQAAFTQLGVGTELASTARKTQPGACFAGYEQFDLLSRGQKIAGAAQRRRRDGLLIQGSIQPPLPALPRADWQQAMCDAGRLLFGATWSNIEPDPRLAQRALMLEEQKYSQPSYNRKRA
jgi:lipoate-protein ligase A